MHHRRLRDLTFQLKPIYSDNIRVRVALLVHGYSTILLITASAVEGCEYRQTQRECPFFLGEGPAPDPGHGPTWHPLAFHCLDVAAVGEALLMRHHGLDDSLSCLLGLSRKETVSLVCFLLALHDIGKFAKKFQAKVPKHCPGYFDDDPTRLAGVYDHGAGGLRLFDAAGDLFNLPSGGNFRLWRPLISAVAGHHGAPPEPRYSEGHAVLQGDYGRAGSRRPVRSSAKRMTCLTYRWSCRRLIANMRGVRLSLSPGSRCWRTGSDQIRYGFPIVSRFRISRLTGLRAKTGGSRCCGGGHTPGWNF